MENFNELALVGDIVGSDKNLAVIRTINETQKDVYETDQLVHLGNLKLPKAKRVEITGHLEVIGKDPAIVADKIREAEEEPYANEAHLIGQAFLTVQYMPPKEMGQTGFATPVLKLGKLLVQGKTWGGFAAAIARVSTKGSLLQLYGRLQSRSFTDREGEERTAVEIVCDEDLTKVLKAKRIESRFAASMGQMGQTQATMTALREKAPAKPASKPEGKPVKAI